MAPKRYGPYSAKSGNKYWVDAYPDGRLGFVPAGVERRIKPRRHSGARINVACKLCKKVVEVLARRVRFHKAHNSHGPFCGKSCAGKWNRAQQIANGLSNLHVLAGVVER